MSYELHFHPIALKEWKKLAKGLQEQFKKILKRRLENPHVVSAMLSGALKDCYKIKLRQSATKNKVSNLGPIHIVNVWCCENQLALGQQIVSGKSNEITAIPLLLDLLELEGATVTIDAMGCQKELSEKIREKNADYIFSLKGNHSNLHGDVRLYFESLHQQKLDAEVFA